jgi:hypothetical protein
MEFLADSEWQHCHFLEKDLGMHASQVAVLQVDSEESEFEMKLPAQQYPAQPRLWQLDQALAWLVVDCVEIPDAKNVSAPTRYQEHNASHKLSLKCTVKARTQLTSRSGRGAEWKLDDLELDSDTSNLFASPSVISCKPALGTTACPDACLQTNKGFSKRRGLLWKSQY